MNTELATDEVTDGIAHIEMQRQDAEKETGRAAACSEALRKLQELLAHEHASMQQDSPDAGRSANIEAVTSEINRVTRLAGVSAQRPDSRNARPGRQQKGLRNGPRNSGRHRGRKTMERNGGR